MAKKRKTTRRRYTKKSKRSGPKAKPMGIAGGAALVGGELLLKRNPVYYDPVTYLKTGDFANAFKSLQTNVVDPKRYKYGLAGILVSGSKSIPIISMVARPADRGIKRLTKGKWGL